MRGSRKKLTKSYTKPVEARPKIISLRGAHEEPGETSSGDVGEDSAHGAHNELNEIHAAGSERNPRTELAKELGEV